MSLGGTLGRLPYDDDVAIILDNDNHALAKFVPFQVIDIQSWACHVEFVIKP